MSSNSFSSPLSKFNFVNLCDLFFERLVYHIRSNTPETSLEVSEKTFVLDDEISHLDIEEKDWNDLACLLFSDDDEDIDEDIDVGNQLANELSLPPDYEFVTPKNSPNGTNRTLFSASSELSEYDNGFETPKSCCKKL